MKILTIAITLFILAGACKKQDNCTTVKPTAAFLFDYPDTVQVNETFNLNVSYVVENSCGDFGEFEVDKYENTLEVKLKAHYEGCDCDNEFQEKSVDYPITFIEAGIYELKFWTAENEFNSYFIVVEE